MLVVIAICTNAWCIFPLVVNHRLITKVYNQRPNRLTPVVLGPAMLGAVPYLFDHSDIRLWKWINIDKGCCATPLKSNHAFILSNVLTIFPTSNRPYIHCECEGDKDLNLVSGSLTSVRDYYGVIDRSGRLLCCRTQRRGGGVGCWWRRGGEGTVRDYRQITSRENYRGGEIRNIDFKSHHMDHSTQAANNRRVWIPAQRRTG